ncbi:phage holin family protein [Streptomyces sp. NPDC058914]|uniref:phage holin family protein n=1 Tax=Streptomyces sp. NPDC058914 TaxID=3346671 RepID=UPI0036941744
MLVLAGILPDFRLQSPDGDSATTIAVTAAVGAGVFGVLSALAWPLLVRLLLLVPALVLGLLVFFLNGSLLLLALRLNPSGQSEAAPETAVIVAAVMSAVASATGGALAVRDDDAYRRRLYRLADRRRRGGPACPSAHGTVFLQLDGVGHDVLVAAVGKGLMPTIARWLGHDTGHDAGQKAGQHGMEHGSRHGVREHAGRGAGHGMAHGAGNGAGLGPGHGMAHGTGDGAGLGAGRGVARGAGDSAGLGAGHDVEDGAGHAVGQGSGDDAGHSAVHRAAHGMARGAGDGAGLGPGHGMAYGAGDGAGHAVGPGSGDGAGHDTMHRAGHGMRSLVPGHGAVEDAGRGTGHGDAHGTGHHPGHSTAHGPGTGPAYGLRASTAHGPDASTAPGPGTSSAHGPGPGSAHGRGPGPGHLPGQSSRPRPRPTHRLTPWRTDWSSQTGASQLGILHGSNHDVPAFRWYEKETREVMVCNRPTSAAELQRRAVERTGDGGLLSADGASRGNLFGGGADEQALVLSIATRRRSPANRSRAGYFAYFSDPANAVRTALSFVAEAAREVGQSTRARLRKERPRVARGGLYPFIRAFATVVERDVVVAAVMGDLLAGRTAVYADLVAYDEVAHHSGPLGRDAEQVLARLDRSLALIEKVAEHAPRPYRIVVLSDHGQSPGETFRARYGLTLGDLVRAGCGLPVPRRAERTHSGAEARAAVRAALRRPVEEGDERHRPTPDSEPVVLASGNLGLVSFPDVPHRMSKEEMDARHPALLTTLANHPGIGFLLVRSEEHGGVVLGPYGTEIPVDRLDEEPGPLAGFGPGAVEAVRRTHSFPHTADIMVNSFHDPADGEVLSFEEQIGSHGGLGGAQAKPFLLSPLALSAPVADGEDLIGAEHVHRVLRRWLRESDGPQVPLEPAREERAA